MTWRFAAGFFLPPRQIRTETSIEAAVKDDGKAVRVRVTGRVQGVNFRAWTCAEAERLGLTGWVRNEDDGSVAALLAGSDAAITMMLERLRMGPPAAYVADIAMEAADPDEAPGRFAILY
jgi:acylphosphatase